MKWLKISVVLFLLLFLYEFLYQTYLQVLPIMEQYGELQLRQFTSAVVMHCKNEVFKENMNDKMIQINRSLDGTIESIDYDMIYVNRMTDLLVSQTEATIIEVQKGNYVAKDDSRYEKYLESVSEKEGVLTGIPLESLISFPPVSFLHCRIPVRFQVESNVVGKVEQHIESYGINNTLIQIDVTVTMHQKMMLPFFMILKP